jgi:predicted DNA-binding transcriptional regulator YafY
VNRTDRLYALVEELRAAAPRRRSVRWLASRFEVSARTIERDLSALQQSGLPIWADAGRLGGYTIDASATLAPLALTTAEALAVIVALGAQARGPFRGDAATALRKIVAVMPEQDARRARVLAARYHFLEDASPAPSGPPELFDAVKEGRVLRLTYRSADGAVTERDVEPLGYISRDGAWYLVAWCRLRDGVRAFRADRAITASLTDERPPPRVVATEDLGIVYGDLRSAAE